MSVICAIAAVYMFKNNISPETEFLIVWALFSIADALWCRRL